MMTLAEPSSSNTSAAVFTTEYMDMSSMFHEGGPTKDIDMISESSRDNVLLSNTAAGTTSTSGIFRTAGRCARDGIIEAWR